MSKSNDISVTVIKDLLDTEKRVLRRKSMFLEEVLMIPDDVLRRLSSGSLLTDCEYRELRVRINIGKVPKC